MTTEARDIAFSLSPFHLLQAICMLEPGRPMTILSSRAITHGKVLDGIGGTTITPVEHRTRVYDELRASGRPYRFFHAVPWNRAALQFEMLALRNGGAIGLFDDGIANFRVEPLKRNAEYYFRRLAYRLLDGTDYCGDLSDVKHSRIARTLYSVDAARSSLAPRARQIDFSRLEPILDRASSHFAHLERHRGLPVFLDTDDCEGGWYDFERKVEVLQDVLPHEPTLYLPHPRQHFDLPRRLPFLIDLTGQTNDWNELAVHYLRPPRVTSVFSTAVITLTKVLGMKFENVLLCDHFLERIGHASFVLDPHSRQMLTSGAADAPRVEESHDRAS